jgi:hypothetical protein
VTAPSPVNALLVSTVFLEIKIVASICNFWDSPTAMRLKTFNFLPEVIGLQQFFLMPLRPQKFGMAVLNGAATQSPKMTVKMGHFWQQVTLLGPSHFFQWQM